MSGGIASFVFAVSDDGYLPIAEVHERVDGDVVAAPSIATGRTLSKSVAGLLAMSWHAAR